MRVARIALALSVLLVALGLAAPATADHPVAYRYGGAEITRWWNDHRNPNITLEQGRVLAHFFNGVIEGRLRRYLNAIAANSIPYEANWDRVAACESGGNWSIHNPSGQYHGGLQFSLGTWQAYGGTGDPHYQSKRAQIIVAERVRTQSGLHHWPICGSRWYG